MNTIKKYCWEIGFSVITANPLALYQCCQTLTLGFWDHYATFLERGISRKLPLSRTFLFLQCCKCQHYPSQHSAKKKQCTTINMCSSHHFPWICYMNIQTGRLFLSGSGSKLHFHLPSCTSTRPYWYIMFKTSCMLLNTLLIKPRLQHKC